jgi:hypothetical protein
VVLSPNDFAVFNPNTRTCPIFRTRADAELIRAIYRRVPILVNERGAAGAPANPWGVEFMQGLFNMTSDSHLFHDAPGPGLVPLYEAKLFHQYNHRWATYDGGDARDATPLELADPGWQVRPRYWVSRPEMHSEEEDRWPWNWLVALRDIARNTDERTAIVSVVPFYGVGHTAPLMLPKVANAPKVVCLIANMNSLSLDFVARQKVGGTHLTHSFLKQFPVLPPTAYSSQDTEFISSRVLELTFTCWDVESFARDLGYDGPPFPWDEERRALLRAELDAYYAALYGLTRDELRYSLDSAEVYGPDFPGETFRVLKEREIKQYGEYRTRRLVLEAWDRLGLAPRNRDRRYTVEAAGSSLDPRQPGNAKPSVGRSSEHGKAKRAVAETEVKWPTRQAGLPGEGEGSQGSFGELGTEK